MTTYISNQFVFTGYITFMLEKVVCWTGEINLPVTRGSHEKYVLTSTINYSIICEAHKKYLLTPMMSHPITCGAYKK